MNKTKNHLPKLDNLLLTEKENKIRNFPAAIKEWKISAYAYNKNTLKNLPSKHSQTLSIIKNYFYLSNIKTKPRSKRMRSLRRKFTSKKIFVTKPEIKQTNDKVSITIFTFNRERQFLLKKLFFFNRRQKFLDIWRINNSLASINKSIITDLNCLNTQNPVLFNKKVNTATKWFINNNKDLYAQFSSNVLSQKDKLRLYYKIYQKINSNINKTKLNNMKTYPNHKLYYIANKNNIRSYKKKRRLFKKNRTEVIKPWYVRKNMKGFSAKRRRVKTKKRIIPYSGIKLKNELNFLSFKLGVKNKQFAYIRKLFYFYFLRYVLSMFNVKLYAFKKSNLPSNTIIKKVLESRAMKDIEIKTKKQRKGKRNKKSKYKHIIDKKLLPLYNSPRTLTPEGTNIKLYFYVMKKNETTLCNKKILPKVITNIKPLVIKFNILHSNNKLDNLNYAMSNINYIASQFLEKILIKSLIKEKERKLQSIFKNFCKKYYVNFLKRFWKQDTIISNNYTKLMINRFKFSKFLPSLKLLISKIYNKKTELNIISLKYPQLNTEIYTQIIALKLRRKLSAYRVIRKALGLAKIPRKYVKKSNINIDYNINSISRLKAYKPFNSKYLSEDNKINSVSIQDTLDKIYPRNLMYRTGYITSKIKTWGDEQVIQSKLKNILNTVKYKTISGVKLQAAGRLTKRHSASRSVLIVKRKGNLKNIDYSRRVEYIKKSMSVVMLRNQVKANSQYNLATSKRRIGAFGVKGWISGY